MLECKTTQRRDQRALFGAERMRSGSRRITVASSQEAVAYYLMGGERGRERENTDGGAPPPPIWDESY